MKEKEEIHTQIGVYNLPRGLSDAGNKVLQIFTKLKRKAKEMETLSPSIPQSPAGPGSESTPIRDLEPNFAELRDSAMNSYRLRSDVIKTESRFEVV